MSGDQRPHVDAADGDLVQGRERVRPSARRGSAPAPSPDTTVAVEVRQLVERGDMEAARERFGELVALHQRRASGIAYQYLRDAPEADEAVEEICVKVSYIITSYREAWPFEV